MNRAQHVAWVRGRALDELSADGPNAISNAIASATSDLRKHPETAAHSAIELTTMLAMGGHLSTPDQVRDWIEGIW